MFFANNLNFIDLENNTGLYFNNKNIVINGLKFVSYNHLNKINFSDINYYFINHQSYGTVKN